MRILLALALVILANATAAAAENAPAPRAAGRTCFSTAQTRDRIADGGLIEPFALVRAKARELRAEAISIKLCQTGERLTYDVDFLRPDGRVVHAQFEAKGALSETRPGKNERQQTER